MHKVSDNLQIKIYSQTHVIKTNTSHVLFRLTLQLIRRIVAQTTHFNFHETEILLFSVSFPSVVLSRRQRQRKFILKTYFFKSRVLTLL